MSEEQKQRTERALAETLRLLERAESYAPENRDQALIQFYLNHIKTLKKKIAGAGLKRFRVSVIETVWAEYDVEAVDQAEAIEKVLAGEGDFWGYGEGLEKMRETAVAEEI